MIKPATIDDFEKLAPLVKGYELKPGVTYLIVADGKNFKLGLVQALMRDLELYHPELNVCIIGTLHPKGLAVMEKKPEDVPESSNL